MATILIMEDQLELAEAWAELLKMDQHGVLICASGSEALATAQARRVDLVIADIFVRHGGALVPDGGILLIGRLRALEIVDDKPWLRRLPIIAVSGGGMIEDRGDPLQTAQMVGADLVLRKPVEGAVLRAVVNDLLSRAARDQSGDAKR